MSVAESYQLGIEFEIRQGKLHMCKEFLFPVVQNPRSVPINIETSGKHRSQKDETTFPSSAQDYHLPMSFRHNAIVI